MARLREPELSRLEQALYEERSLVRMLGMRRTVFVVPREVAPVVQAACAQAIAVQERRRTLQLLEQIGLADEPEAWLRSVEESTLAALRARGEASAAELGRVEPRLAQQIPMAVGKAYAGTLGVSTRVLFGLAAAGRVVRGRPRGSWNSTQYRWATTEAWLDDGLPEMDVAGAQADLVRRWLAAFGPGTLQDLKWWTGLSLGEVRRALAWLGDDAVEIETDAGQALALSDDLEPVEPLEADLALLPALDATPMGWVEREWYLGDLGPALFDRSGNIGPTVWWGGRIVGGWAQRGSGEVVWRLLVDVGREARLAAEQAAAELSRWLGPARVKPRFRTPLERELASA